MQLHVHSSMQVEKNHIHLIYYILPEKNILQQHNYNDFIFLPKTSDNNL